MTTRPPPPTRHLDDVQVVRIHQLLVQLQTPRLKAVWPIARIAAAAGLPKSIVYRAMEGKNVNVSTLQAIAKVFGGELVIMMRRRKP
jgi:DNA-binding phage protein